MYATSVVVGQIHCEVENRATSTVRNRLCRRMDSVLGRAGMLTSVMEKSGKSRDINIQSITVEISRNLNECRMPQFSA